MVIIDWMVRHSFLDPDTEPNYLQIVHGISVDSGAASPNWASAF